MAKGIRLILMMGLTLLSACNHRLNIQKIEADIEADIERQGRRITLNTVICPENVTKQADAYFRCVGELDSGEIFTINVIQQDDKGTVVWDVPSSKTLLNLVSLEADIQQELSQVVAQRVTVSCDGAYRVNERGDSFECDVVGLITSGTDRIDSVLIEVDAEGNVGWREVRWAIDSSPSQGNSTSSEAAQSSAAPQPTGKAVAANPEASDGPTHGSPAGIVDGEDKAQ